MEFIISYAHFLVLSLFHSNPSHQIYIGIVDSVVFGGIAWDAVSQITYSLRDQINSDDADFFLCGVKHILHGEEQAAGVSISLLFHFVFFYCRYFYMQANLIQSLELTAIRIH